MNQHSLIQLAVISGLAGMQILASGRSVQAEQSQSTPAQINVAQLAADLLTPAEETTPAPGTVATTARSLQTESFIAQATTPTPETTPAPGLETTPAPAPEATPTPAPETAPAPTPEATPAPTPEPTTPTISPGRATRSGPSYIAVGGNIGFGGRTALGRGNFTITSKVGLTNNFSARPGLVIGRSPTILLPVTVDFPVRSVVDDRIRIAPFVGGGLAISTRGGSEVRALAMGGIDVPLTDRLTATASANAAFFRRPEIGVILGVGYNF